ncbi:MAG: DNA alkylation repair protein [Patescibacteria group bacterium]
MNKIIQELDRLKNKEKAKILQRFFKTAKGEYGEGDLFLGITVPQIRQIAKNNLNTSLEELQKLLNSKIHEYRLVALLILVENYKKTEQKDKIFKFYLKNFKNINNWDLVDLSAPKIIGDYIFHHKILDKKLLKWANSKHLWTKRISIVSTYFFIKENNFKHTLVISKILLNDKHDLIHKAVGWMLRELGKKDKKVLENFLNENLTKMPRNSLRYAIEKFPENQRKEYLKKSK